MSWRNSAPRSSEYTRILVGTSPRIQEVSRLIDRVAETDIPVVICGESGSGKEVVAQLIHRKSQRSRKLFLKLNCAAIPHELLESELFGFERGSFTGAYKSKPGMFEMAHSGTIFLDEISEMPMSLQPKLLQVLQDKQFCRLGAQREIQVDVRFISATNRPFEKLLSDGKFREDLYYRLNVITIQLPPLRERKSDIPELVEHLVRKHASASKNGNPQLPDSMIDVFQQYDWPGNVRQLENTIRKMLALGNQEELLDTFPFEGGEDELVAPQVTPEDFPSLSIKEAAKRAARQAEREMILLALQKTNWNRKRAAGMLNISYKSMLYKLKGVGLTKNAQIPDMWLNEIGE